MAADAPVPRFPTPHQSKSHNDSYIFRLPRLQDQEQQQDLYRPIISVHLGQNRGPLRRRDAGIKFGNILGRWRRDSSISPAADPSTLLDLLLVDLERCQAHSAMLPPPSELLEMIR